MFDHCGVIKFDIYLLILYKLNMLNSIKLQDSLEQQIGKKWL